MTSDCISLYILYWPAAALISLSGVLDLDIALHPLLFGYPLQKLLCIWKWHMFVIAGKTFPYQREREEFTSSANQLGCTDVPGLSVTWSKTSVLSVYHV